MTQPLAGTQHLVCPPMRAIMIQGTASLDEVVSALEAAIDADALFHAGPLDGKR